MSGLTDGLQPINKTLSLFILYHIFGILSSSMTTFFIYTKEKSLGTGFKSIIIDTIHQFIGYVVCIFLYLFARCIATILFIELVIHSHFHKIFNMKFKWDFRFWNPVIFMILPTSIYVLLFCLLSLAPFFNPLRYL